MIVLKIALGWTLISILTAAFLCVVINISKD